MKNRTTKNSAARHGVGKQTPLNCYCPWMEYEVWTVRYVSGFAAATFYHHLLVSLRDTESWSTPHRLMTQCRGSIMMQQYVLWFILILHDHAPCGCHCCRTTGGRIDIVWLPLILFFGWGDKINKLIANAKANHFVDQVVNRLLRGWDRGAINGLYYHISQDFTSATSSHPECNAYVHMYTCTF